VDEAVAFLADHGAFFKLHVVKVHFAVADLVPANLDKVLNFYAGSLGINPPHGKAALGILGLGVAGEHKHVGKVARAGDKGLLPVEVHLAVAARGGCGQQVVVRTGLRFGEQQRIGGNALLGALHGHFQLFPVSPADHVVHAQGVGQQIASAAHAGQLFNDQHLGQHVSRDAVKLFGNTQEGNAVFRHGGHELHGKAAIKVALAKILVRKVALHHFAHAGEQQFLFFRKPEIHLKLLF